MRRHLGWLVSLGLAATATVPVHAQGRVRLEVTVSDPINDAGVRQPRVRTPGILRDARWRDALLNSFPLRIRYRVEIWRVRPDWFDAQERAFEWEALVQQEPLTDQYSRTTIFRGSPRAFERFATLQELELDLEKVQQVAISPPGPGEFYFAASVEIRTLTDEEMEELERFLQGEPSERDDPAGRPGGLGRAARRFLLRVGGLPAQDLDAKSDRFVIR